MTSRPDLLQGLADARARRVGGALGRRTRTVGRDVAAPVSLFVDGRRLLDFASNDYLALARDAAVVDALAGAARRTGVGAGAAHLLGGHREEHAALEEALAAWTGRSRALLFSTGYMANLGVLQALLAPAEPTARTTPALCVQDKLNHACLIDGARLAGCELKRYPHADVEAARRQFGTRPGAAAMLATDGVFSMDGDIAPLRALAALCAEEQALLMVDDAHGLGVLGPRGAGSLAESGLDETAAPVLMATLGKALGVAGAFVAGSASLIDGLVQFARPYIYTTAMPPALAAACLAAVGIARDDGERRQRLLLNIERFRAGAAARGLPLLPSRTAIQPLLVGDSVAALQAAQTLEAAGFFVPAIRPPTVPEGSARLRVTLSAAHVEADIDGLLAALSRCLPRSGAAS
ncbi:MAG TPA: 8-amino-7-oxononanoate synthase [Dokdonella sp.]|uniref:8-amino-7-oxononanoate synthase n=1 Tax=Dokdonella sp. TaxID=2291710 RepID=UPI0025B85E4C|nr:8-amino-7-oxononanoate synthase [Dokdonella sp.]HNR90939.1 8-amino-7-oxononanoate synthase [Dokdonella sp.]